jgi:diguanylate cyclase (GGDEF)-like protein
MLEIDLLTTYVVCGAASCAGAVLTTMARTGDPALSRSIRVSGIGFAVLGLSLLLSVVNARLAAQLAARAMTDELTGAPNRHALGEQVPALASAVQAAGGTLAVMLLDIDHFEAVNDQHGHAAGDAVLRQLVPVLRGPLRQDALVLRYGGEEFAVLVPVHSADAAQAVAERVRSAVADTPFRTEGCELPVTVSIGLTLARPGEGPETALQRADAALYRAKQGGRNRVEVQEAFTAGQALVACSG